MTKVYLASDAQADFLRLPVAMKVRVQAVIHRLEDWPDVSGVKWLTHAWAGHGRVRVGAWRVVFRFLAPNVLIVRIKHRSEVYED